VYTGATVTGVERIGVRDLRNDVAAVIRRAAAGERITVTVDGVPTAQLGPLEPTARPTLDDLVAAGLVEPPRRPGPPAPPDPLDLAVDVRLDDVLDDLRGG
jgi:prevent-host-death family protein